ncbi:MAG: hypothetical protein HQ567_00670 [Candidatus Nealsonbacteria bacterium]|nr:hypothetical protein [Candidatus Nealsonbacteria bacterium]
MGFEHLSEETIAYAKQTIQCKTRRLVGQAGLSSSDLDDLKQEMWADLLRRFSWFESDRAKAKTFIDRVVSHNISAIRKHRTRMGRDYRRNGGSLSDATKDDDGRIVEQAQVIPEDAHDLRTGAETRSTLEHVMLASDVKTVMASLPTPLRELCQLLKTETLAAAARKLGISRRAAQTRLAAVREHFEEADLCDYL